MAVYVYTGGKWHKTSNASSVYVYTGGKWKQAYQLKLVYWDAYDDWLHNILLTDKSESVTGPRFSGNSVSLSHVKNGSTIKVYGYIFVYGENYSGTRVDFQATGATPSTRTVYLKNLNNDISLTFTATSDSVTIRRQGQVLGGDSNEDPQITTSYTQNWYFS